ncbi:hypothetical protein J2X45_003734 [Caulobacter sp. BE264]|uniref:DUF305 domain-containing protein n=1 Tax=Caulobacter sp. BE264 TaxID=2817724 RepID=UPI002854E89F|nr:DUF305 domain-containing protein [Caulobacter sp. BE264]MDR7232625.1 hypothetical protein [Caulobacter sp. BE264]
MRKILIAVYAVSLLSAAGVAGASAQSMAGHDMKGMDMSKGGMKGHAQMGRDALKMDEMRMSKAMMAAKASDFDLLWAKKMIAHHQGAIDMSQIAAQARRRCRRQTHGADDDRREHQSQGRPGGLCPQARRLTSRLGEDRRRRPWRRASVSRGPYLRDKGFCRV